jgi:hypothetical protein
VPPASVVVKPVVGTVARHASEIELVDRLQVARIR